MKSSRRFTGCNLDRLRSVKFLFLSIIIVLLAAPQWAVAQSGNDSLALEEVIVTATKRTESLQDVAVSVTAFNASDMARLEITNSTELLIRVPNLDYRANAGSTNANLFLRGVGSAGIAFNLQSGVGIYSDEVVLNSPVVNILQVYDLERVEVLRGPQNTLYGRNTTGGAINFISNKPEVGGEANGFLNTIVGRFGEVSVEAAGETPLGDQTAIRGAMQYQTRGGDRTNLITGNKDEEIDKLAGRIQLAYQPNERVSIMLKGHIEHVRSENIRYKVEGAFAPDAVTPDPNNPCATPFKLGACSNGYGFVDTADPREFSSNMDSPENSVNAGGGSAHINVDFENFTLTSITAYEANSQQLSEDSDAWPGFAFHFSIDSEQDQWSQEFRLTSNTDTDFRWIVGAYGFWENMSGSVGPTFGTPMGTMLVRSQSNYDNTNYSAYAHFDYDVAEKVTLKGGFRYGYDNVKNNATAIFALQSQLLPYDVTTPSFSGAMMPPFDDLLNAALASGARVLSVDGSPYDPTAPGNDETWNLWGGELGIEYRPTDEVLIYGQWNRGFKSGTFNAAPMSITLGLGVVPVDPEIVYAYEVGAKTEFADGAARLNTSLFYYDYQDQQVSQSVNGEFQVFNVDSEIWGGEVELDWVPAEGYLFHLGAAYLNTDITDALDPDFIGKHLISSPEFTFYTSLRKEWLVSNGALFSLSADARYASKRYYTLNNDISDDPYTVVDMQASYQFGSDGEYQVSLWGKNIFNTLYYNNMFAYDDNGDGYTDYRTVYMNTPVTYGISFRVIF